MTRFKIVHDLNNDFVEPATIDFETVAHFDQSAYYQDVFGRVSISAINDRGGLTIYQLWCIENQYLPFSYWGPDNQAVALSAGHTAMIQSWFDYWSQSRFKYTVRPTE